jgi:hypothetical protein
MSPPVDTSDRSSPFRDEVRNRPVVMRLEFEISPEVWLSGFTRRHPEVFVEVHNTLMVSRKETLGEFEIRGPPRDWSGEIAGFPDVIKVDRLQVLPGLVRYRVRFHQPVYLHIVHELEMHLQFPRSAANGIYSCETIARASEVRRLVSALRAAGCRPRVVLLRGHSFRRLRPTLTPVQRELFRRALASGYFEVPRRITLTKLAENVSRSKSSVSRTLAVVEQKLAELARRVGA